jgi:hypothetical protein
MDSNRRSLAEFGNFVLVSKQSQSILVTARFARLERAAISDGIERGCRGRETAKFKVSGLSAVWRSLGRASSGYPTDEMAAFSRQNPPNRLGLS